jgi:hypothetical protein
MHLRGPVASIHLLRCAEAPHTCSRSDIARMHTSGKPAALIQSAWGGTRVEAWMSKQAIAEASPSAGAAPPTGHSAQNNASVLCE